MATNQIERLGENILFWNIPCENLNKRGIRNFIEYLEKICFLSGRSQNPGDANGHTDGDDIEIISLNNIPIRPEKFT